MYIIKFEKSGHEIDIFVTSNKKEAIKYVKKFNTILKKWELYYSKYEIFKGGIVWLDDKYADLYFNRWIFLRSIDKCYYTKIEIR